MKKLLLIAVSALFVVGCSKVDQVKSGTFSQYSTTTIGDAFDATFGQTEWIEAQTAKGQDFVELTGFVDDDFMELVASTLYRATKNDVSNPLSNNNLMNSCLGTENARQIQTEMFGAVFKSLGLVALAGEEAIGEVVTAGYLSALQEKSKKIMVQFMFVNQDDADFVLSYYGMDGDDWNGCEISQFLMMNEFMNFVFGSHTYSAESIKGLAVKIVDEWESSGTSLEDLVSQQTANLSSIQVAVLKLLIDKDSRVVKKKEDEAKAAAEKKRLEEEEAARVAAEEAARKQAEMDDNLNTALKEIVPSLKGYKNKIEQWRKKCANGEGSNCNEYPYWEVIGYKPPTSEYFNFKSCSGYSWCMEMSLDAEKTGKDCSWSISCTMVNQPCECNVSEECKTLSPELSKICSVEYN